MKFSNIYKFLLCLLPITAFSQTSYIIRGTKEETLLNRLEIKSKTKYLLFSTNKPYTRRDAVRDVEKLDSLYEIKDSSTKNLSAIDKYNMQRFLMNNSDWSTPREIYKSEKPLLKNFYKTRGDMINFNNNDFVLIANPIIEYQMGGKAGNTKSNFTNVRGALIRGILDKKVGFDFYFTENQERTPGYVVDWTNKYQALPGVGYLKTFKDAGAYDYFDIRGSVSWKVAKFMDMQFGYDRNFIGNGYRSLFMSDFATNGMFLKVNTHFGKFNYENLFMELVSLHRRGSDYVYPRKYFRMSHLSYNPTSWLNVGLFDGTILANSACLTLKLFNPVIYANIPNGKDKPQDKTFTGFDIKANLAKKVQLYGQLMVDKLKMDELSKDSWNNRFGYQLGAKYIDAFGVNNLDIQVETNRVRPFTYSGNDSVKNYTHYNQPFAHPLGANFEEYILIVKAQPFKKLHLDAKVIYYQQGLDSAGFNAGQNPFKFNSTRTMNEGWKIGSGNLAKCMIVSLLASYEIKENLYIDMSFLSRQYTTANTGDNNQSLFSLGFRWNIGRREYLF